MITALLTVALVAGLASALVADYGAGLESLAGRHDQAQARWLARGAVDWGRNVLADDYGNGVDHLGEPWAVKVPPTPVEDGEVSGELLEQSGRFNLNNLAPNGEEIEAEVKALELLMLAAGLSPGEAGQAISAIIDWIDIDTAARQGGGDEASVYGALRANSRPPDAPLAHFDELGQIPGIRAAWVERLRPFVTALPAPSLINLNTASAEVMHAVIPKLSIDSARVLVAERERAWFNNKADVDLRLAALDAGPVPASTGVRSDFFLATGRARYGLSVVRMEVLLDRRQKWPEILWQRIL